jgi:putative SOS response-associated peptidase YedK
MCGRYLLDVPGSTLAHALDAIDRTQDMPPTWNAAPAQLLPVLGWNPETRERSLVRMEWGLMPQWAVGMSASSRTEHGAPRAQTRSGHRPPRPQINARAESVDVKPMFRRAFARRRCLIPMRGWYEWVSGDTYKHPWVLVPEVAPDASAVATAAGIWETWREADGASHHTFAIITCDAAPQIRHIHDRQPVLIAQGDRDRWITTPAEAVEDLRELLQPGAHPVRTWEVSRAVNSVANNFPELIAPVAPPAE